MPPLARSSGILLHPTSLPGPFGVGDLGPTAHQWVRWLASAGQSWWQILPLNPTGGGGSPYQCYSAFAGNVALLSPELLHRDGLADLPPDAVARDGIDHAAVLKLKNGLVRQAWDRFRGGKGPVGLRSEFDVYCQKEAGWLDGYALFAAVRAALGDAPLGDWSADLLARKPVALAAVEQELTGEVMLHRFGQFLFDRQWAELQATCREHGVKLIGDAPIFVSADSADVWAHPDQFLLDAHGRPTAVAGVPPDYFSPTGQHWGNPLYDWDAMAKDGYRWWAARLKRLFQQVDVVRLDHFRGFAAAWHIPADETDATGGKWVPGPGAKLFDALRKQLGDLPIIAEDLGLITPDVDTLRLGCGFPGMRVLQFMIAEPTNQYWPHNYDPQTVAYTGTHDNDTTNGWYAKLDDGARWTLGQYLGKQVDDAAGELLRLAWLSVAELAVAPLQDVLGLGGEARMNVPGVAEGNWGWRFRTDQFKGGEADRLKELTRLANRLPAGTVGG